MKKSYIIIAVIILITTLLIIIINNKTIKNIKDITIDIEEKILVNLNEYEEIKDKDKCKVDITKVDNKKIGTYEYYINCKKKNILEI